MTTINRLFEEAVAAHTERVALRLLIPKERKSGRGIRLILNEISYERLGEMASRFATALIEQGIQRGDRIALISKPRSAWATAFFGVLRSGAAVAPLDPELQPGEIERILAEAGVKSVIASGGLIDALREIRTRSAVDFSIVSMDRSEYDDVLFLDALLLGRTPLPAVDVEEKDLAILMYTSGTTGNAKGAMLTHGNIASNAVTTATTVVNLSPSDNFLSIVPWHHIYGLTVTLICAVISGGATTYAPADRNLAQVMLRAKPTIILGVPKLYNLLYGKIRESIERSLLKRTIDRLSPRLMGRLVTHKLFGSGFRFFTSGGAPLSPEVANGFRRMGIGILEGYGLTETSPLLTTCERFATEPGMTAIRDVEIRIAGADEDGVGEVLARGPNIMAGYYNNEAATREVIDDDGWFHTGDLGRLDGERLVLCGRAKNVIVLETGKNVYPEEVEWELVNIPGIDEIMVYEGTRQGTPTVSAMIYPNWTALREAGVETPEAALDTLWEQIKERNENLAVFKRIKARESLSLVDQPFEKSVKLDIKRHKVQTGS